MAIKNLPPAIGVVEAASGAVQPVGSMVQDRLADWVKNLVYRFAVLDLCGGPVK